ncbi:hypothetical protein JT359_07970 [Candidatus Poribacteria bacterium]|nr:hypothetical protein [Candidatus Poribacteria bacterium]
MKRIFSVLILFLLLTTTPGFSWWGGGHDILTQAAVKALPNEMPEFFRSDIAEKMIAHSAYDPDVSKNRNMPNARIAEHGEHYFDLELIKDNPIPENRDAFIKLCAEMNLEPGKVGYLPYSLAEWTERLAIAFAEYRKWPNNPMIQYKCYLYAGFLGHYAQDMCQPLHLTVHFNGIVQDDGTVLHRGIHEKVDSSVEVMKLSPTELAKNQSIKHVEELLPAITKQIQDGFGLVDRVYELVEDYEKLKTPSQELINFTQDRSKESVRWTASLFYTAWKLSDTISLPGWLER